MSVKDQQALDRLYAIDNVLTIEITMPQADWDAVRTEQPAGGPCNRISGCEQKVGSNSLVRNRISGSEANPLGSARTPRVQTRAG